MRRVLFLAAIVLISLLQSTSAGNIHSQCQVGIDSAKQASKAVAELAAKIYQKINKPQENLVFSPVSIALGLALVESGTAGETRNELNRHLAPPGSNQADSSGLYESLQRQLQVKGGDKAALNIANGFFYSADLPVKQAYVNRTKQCFDTEVTNAPFKTNSEEARRQINRWTADKTAQKIPELFKQPNIKPQTVAVLANALYLKAPWLHKFDRTESLAFYKHGQNAQTVPFVIQEHTFQYAENDKAQLVELPYDGLPGVFFYVLLPKQRDGLPTVETTLLNPDQIRAFKASSAPRRVSLKLPKFTVRQRVDLKEVLQKLGVDKVFSQQADFSKLADAHLKLDAAVHETYLKINENGTEAAAATGFAVMPGAAPPPPGGPVSFVADHPFIFAVGHKPTGSILFLGKVTEVKQE